MFSDNANGFAYLLSLNIMKLLGLYLSYFKLAWSLVKSSTALERKSKPLYSHNTWHSPFHIGVTPTNTARW